MNEHQILITVLMPVYNAEAYLKTAIDSILNQSYPHFEFLIIDDGSTDATAQILKTYTDKRIRVIE
ncbi:MAG: glycosyltransferase family 2 protein, partial [Bacteroidia bacterium]